MSEHHRAFTPPTPTPHQLFIEVPGAFESVIPNNVLLSPPPTDNIHVERLGELEAVILTTNFKQKNKSLF